MSIARACYVVCDMCGNPAPVSVCGAKDARILASQGGWKHVTGRDICPHHIVWETGRDVWHIATSERAR